MPADPSSPASRSASLGTQAQLARRRDEIQRRQADGIRQVDKLVREQREVTGGLQEDLGELRRQGGVLDEIEARSQEQGLLAALTRQLTRRRSMLERRSVTEGLFAQYELVSRKLRRAAAFSDELRLCAADLQQQVDQLHAELGLARQEQRRCGGEVQALEADLARAEAPAPVASPAGEGSASAEERARQVDQLSYQLRTRAVELEQHMARERLARQHLEPARQLRDTVLSLQEDMSRFVTAATATVNSAGRRIQALGMAADAPVVVRELQQGLEELDQAMQATQDYVQQSQDLLTRVLPELSRKLEAQGEVEGEVLSSSLEEISRERAKSLADQALRRSAEAEVDDALGRGR